MLTISSKSGIIWTMKEDEQFTTTQELAEKLKAVFGEEKVLDPRELKFVLYARKSTNETEGKQIRSLPDQINECKEFADRAGLKIADTIQEAESAKEPDTRPRFREMIEKLKLGKYDGILSWHPDRLARNMKDAGEIIDLVDKGIIKDLQFVSFSFQNTASGKMLLGITFVLSKHYSDHLSDNVSRGNDRSILEGQYINASKHGYYKDKEQHLHPDGDNFILIKNAFKMRLEHKTMEEIAEYLNESGYKKWHRDENGNGVRRPFKWNDRKIHKLLRDSTYAGVVVYGKKVVDLTQWYDFQLAISVRDFMTLNQIGNKENLIRIAKKQRKKEKIKADLMRGMIICDECSEPMHAGITKKKAKEGIKQYFYYRCDTEDCDRYGKSVRANVITKYIYDFLDTKPFSSPASYEHYKEEMGRVAEERLLETKKLLHASKVQKNKMEEQLLRAKNMLAGSEEESVKVLYRGDLKNIQSGLEGIGKRIEEQTEEIKRGKQGILTYEEFLELMEKTGQVMRKIRNMSELDYLCRKMYMNFTLRGEKVIKSTLNQPFQDLYQAKLHSSGGDVRKFEPIKGLNLRSLDLIIRKLRLIYKEKPEYFDVPSFAVKVY